MAQHSNQVGAYGNIGENAESALSDSSPSVATDLVDDGLPEDRSVIGFEFIRSLIIQIKSWLVNSE